jgi:choline monooxygenase
MDGGIATTLIPSQLKAAIAAFEPDIPIENAATPPSAWYINTTFDTLERRSLFRNNWVAVGRTDQLPEAGSYISAQVGTEPIVVLRNGDNELRAFINVCRHHAACIVKGEGRTEQLTCPYHGWTYDLDGRLRKAPRMGGVQNFNRDEMGLVPVAVTTFGPMVLVCPGTPPPEPARALAGLQERLAATGWMDLKWVAQETYAVASNWKVYVDNYLDGGYHIPTIHPALDAGLQMGGYTTEIFDRYSIQSAQSASADGRMGAGALYAYVYPNLMINRYGPVLDTNRVIPMGPDRCLVVFDYYFERTDGPDSDRFIEDSLASSRGVQGEDADVCARVQRGLASSAYDRGRYAPQVEMGEHHFHRLLHADYMRAMG